MKVISQRIKRRKLSDEVADLLIRDIQSGRYAETDELPSESTLMKEFGVGRPSIRESLAKLARLGLVEVRPGVRPRVRKLDLKPMLQEMKGVVNLALSNPEGQRQLQNMRNLLEAALARESARLATEPQLAVMREALARFQQVLETYRVRDEEFVRILAKLDLEFHRSIIVTIDNPLLILLQENLFDWLLEQRLSTLGSHGQAEVTLAAHQKVYDAIHDHDPDEAERAMAEHLNQVVVVYETFHPGEDGSP